MTNKLICIENLTISFFNQTKNFKAVDSLSFDVKKGEILAIVGESGCGKSVTSRAILRLDNNKNQKISGNIYFYQENNKKVNLLTLSEQKMREIRGAKISMIFQEPMSSLNPSTSIGDQLLETVLIHYSESKKEAKHRIKHMLKKVQFSDPEFIMTRFPHQLSGGMRQRVMIAMALICEPHLLIADEPTTALDVTIQAQVLKLLVDLQKEMNMSIIFVTHDIGVVAQIADRVLVMQNGKRIESNFVENLFSSPKENYTKFLLASVPHLGSMKGKPFPEKFYSNNQNELKIVDYERPPLLFANDLVVKFDIYSGFFGRNKRYICAANHVNFSIYPGETLSLVGESGSGKSTIAKALIGLSPITNGEILYENNLIDYKKEKNVQMIRQNIQCVFQDPLASLNPRFSIGDSIIEPLLIHRLATKEEAKQKAFELLKLVGLKPEFFQRYPHEFSGGQLQRVCIARALILEPKIIIADEAVSALDVSIRAQVLDLLMDLQEKLQVTYLFISHDMAVVERISHRVAVLYLGELVEIGTRQEIFENPQHEYTKKLLGAVPIADPTQRNLLVNFTINDVPNVIRLANKPLQKRTLHAISKTHFVVQN